MPEQQLRNFITVLETTMYLVAANLPPLRSLIARTHKAASRFAKAHSLDRGFSSVKSKSRKWLQYLGTTGQNNKNTDLNCPDDSPRARLGYMPTQQITNFGSDLRREIDEGFDDSDDASLRAVNC